MKRIFFLCLFLTTLVSMAQNKRMEQKSVIEDGIVKKWVIEKEFDNEGNLVNYDSTYSETPMHESAEGDFYYFDSGNGMNFQFGEGFDNKFFNEMDSLGFNRNPWSYNFEELLKNFQGQFNQQFDFVPIDSLKQEDFFVFPEDRKTTKKI